MKYKTRWFPVTGGAVLLSIAGVVLADNVRNNVVTSGAGQNDTFTAGGSTTISYYIEATGGTCDAADGSAALLTINTPGAVTATPNSLAFSQCEAANAKSVVFSAATAGNYSITVSLSDSNGSYNTTPASFTLHVLAPSDTTPPLVTCAVPNASVWYGSNVTVPCTASDAGGLANPADAAFSLSTSVSVGTETPVASTDSRNVCDTSANCTQAGPYTFKVDRASPVLAPGVSPNPVELGGSAVASANASDGGSGIALQGCDPVNTSSVGSKTVNCTATDNVGNSASGAASFLVVDTAPPPVTCTAPNASVWYGGDVTVPCTASDAGGLANPADAAFSLSTSVSVGTETPVASTGSRNVCDASANCTQAGPYTFKVDRASPVLAPAVSPNPVELGGSAVASANASDGGSGIALQGCDPVSTSSVGSKTVNCTATDNVGNSASGAASFLVVDTAPPSVTCVAPDPIPWYGSDVTVPCTASDTGGLANPADAAFSLSTSVSVGTETPVASTGSRNVCDASANCRQAGPYTFKVDRASPVLAPGVSPNPVELDGSAVASANASDGGSGIASQGCESVITSSVGPRTVDCTATDNVGNRASGAASFLVVDTAPPSVTCVAPDPMPWYGSDATVPCTASDTGGLANPADAAFSLSTSVSVGTETLVASTGSRNVCDASANCTQAGPYTFKVDRAAPVLAPSVSPNPVGLNGLAVASANASDGGSGIASQGCESVITSSVGPRTVSCTATDNVGNRSSATADYTVMEKDAAGVPALSELGLFALISILAGAGMWSVGAARINSRG